MNWPAEEAIKKYEHFGYPMGNATAIEYHDTAEKWAMVQSVARTFPQIFQDCMFNLNLPASQMKQMDSWVMKERAWEKTTQMTEFLAQGKRQKDLVAMIMKAFSKSLLLKAVKLYELLLAAQAEDKLNNTNQYWDVVLEHFANLGAASNFHAQFHHTQDGEVTSKKLTAKLRENSAMLSALNAGHRYHNQQLHRSITDKVDKAQKNHDRKLQDAQRAHDQLQIQLKAAQRSAENPSSRGQSSSKAGLAAIEARQKAGQGQKRNKSEMTDAPAKMTQYACNICGGNHQLNGKGLSLIHL